MTTGALRVAVIGSGPAGIYVAGDLLKRRPADVEVDVLDRLYTPWGLVRHGVAPDHPQIKSVTRVFEIIAGRPGFRFFGGVRIGSDVSADELAQHYDAVVYAVGAERSRTLPVPGADLEGSIGAGSFVSWYNGHPDYRFERIRLDAERAVVIGNGNVAVDCARILLKSPSSLSTTDIADHALADLEDSSVKEVVLIGRRGPAEAAFSAAEIGELVDLPGVAVSVDESSISNLDDDAPNTDLVRRLSESSVQDAPKRLVLRFNSNVVEIQGDQAVEAVQVECGATTSSLPCGLVVHAIGFTSTALTGMPVDAGRVVHSGGRVGKAVYAAGWFKRGPSGVIGTNKKCAAETVDTLLADLDAGLIPRRGVSSDAVAAWLHDRKPGLVEFAGWRMLDAAEIAAGAERGRPRIKFDLDRQKALFSDGPL